MPFGLKNAGATYQRAMERIFDDMLHKNVECYMDNLVVKSVKRKDHPKDLRVVFERLMRYQLTMNPFKCAFGVTSGKFLGFVVHRHGIEIKQAKIEAIVALAEPRNIHELKSLQACSAAFQDIKSYLMSPPVLVAPIIGKPLILYIAAQEQLVGTLLAQENDKDEDVMSVEVMPP
ncbi:hypothetical protein LIER_41507 [Lithospermum erythrorhizon]|uniref:Reverse transcriptase domain-containing protein n=1 Tax=Lithospermum erythrorhizon TaxID=34254 RepID=A0AAV3REC6_LITER